MKNCSVDIAVIGAGPCGLFSAFEAGLFNMGCAFIDVLPIAGGQCAEIYPKKPIYDIPGFPKINAEELVTNILEQIKPFQPIFCLGEKAISIKNTTEDTAGEYRFCITTDQGSTIWANAIFLAGGLGVFTPKKPAIPNIDLFEGLGVDYFVKDPNKYAGKDIVIAGGGDSALDWTLSLKSIANSVTLVHRRGQFRGAPHSVAQLMELSSKQEVKLATYAQIVEIFGNPSEPILNSVTVLYDGGKKESIKADYFIPLFGLDPNTSFLTEWGLNLTEGGISVSQNDYQSSIEGIYVVGDMARYPGKLKLILSGFHEAALAVQSAYRLIKKEDPIFRYTTVMEGVTYKGSKFA